MKEIWKDGIYIDENGNVLILNGIQVSNTEKLCKNGKTFDYSNFNGASPYITFRYYGKTLKFHRLVLSTFNPVSDTYVAINHKDFNKHHNTPSNLEWCTYDYNNRYSNLYIFLDNTGKKLNEETKKKISESLKGRRQTDETREKIGNKLLGRHLTESAKRKLSESKKGKKMSEETKKKISKLLINGKTSKSVCQYDMNDNYIATFPSMSEAERCGYKSSYICKVCKGQLPYAYGFKWRYAE